MDKMESKLTQKKEELKNTINKILNNPDCPEFKLKGVVDLLRAELKGIEFAEFACMADIIEILNNINWEKAKEEATYYPDDIDEPVFVNMSKIREKIIEELQKQKEKKNEFIKRLKIELSEWDNAWGITLIVDELDLEIFGDKNGN
jgi:hypothetical protein